jgi:hypothetical protein
MYRGFCTPNRHEKKRTTPHHIIIKMPKLENRGRILKTREKHSLVYKRKHIKITTDLSAQTLNSKKA